MAVAVDIEKFTRERFEARRFVIGRVGPHALKPDLTINPFVTEIEVGAYKFRARDNFQRLALQHAVDFLGVDTATVAATVAAGRASAEEQRDRTILWMTELRHSSQAAFGFLVTGHLLGYTPLAYEEYCRERGTEPDLDELAAIAGSQTSFEKTAKFLAKMSGPNSNRHWERAAHLTEGTYQSLPDWTPLVITPDEHFDFSGEVRWDAFSKIREADRKPETYGECPATEVFLPRLWQKMVAECVEQPELFPAAIANMTAMAVTE